MQFFKNLILLLSLATQMAACGASAPSAGTEVTFEPEIKAQAGTEVISEPELETQTQNQVQTQKGIDPHCFHYKVSAEPLRAQTLNGYSLNSNELENLHWIKKCVLPHLPGSAASRIKNVAQVSWWSLREGVLELNGERLFRYANCHFSRTGDRVVSNLPLWNCETNIWQVGIMAGQVMNYSLESISRKIGQLQAVLGPDVTEHTLLEWTANLAGYAPGSEVSRSILASTGRVRRSWLMRNPLLGMLLVKTEVVDECLNGTKRWCFAGDYPEARKFSGSRSRMLRSIQELEAYFSSSEFR